ncbi:MAG: hypothetical protein HQL41_18880 [Alphaproteobacteria bacterium]|nr:hypothetical protein [Alphaproteobacteria bacterium]
MMSHQWPGAKSGETNDLIIGYVERGEWLVMAFGNSTWALDENRNFPVVVDVDDKWHGEMSGQPIDKDRFAVLMPASRELVGLLGEAREIVMTMGGPVFRYAIDAPREAVAALGTCRAQSE